MARYKGTRIMHAFHLDHVWKHMVCHHGFSENGLRRSGDAFLPSENFSASQLCDLPL